MRMNAVIEIVKSVPTNSVVEKTLQLRSEISESEMTSVAAKGSGGC